MSDINSIKLLKDILRKISHNSVLEEIEAFEIIKDAMIPPLLLDFISDKMIDLANRRVPVEIIKIEVYSLMSQISIAGGLENFRRII